MNVYQDFMILGCRFCYFFELWSSSFVLLFDYAEIGEEEHSRHFGGRPIDGLEVNWLPRLDADAPLLDDCVAHVVARVVDIHSAGDHTLYIGHVEYLRYWEQRPLLFFSGKYKQIEAREPMNAWSISSEGW